MKYLVIAGRMIFGGWMVYAGLNHWFHFTPQPYGQNPLSIELTTALIESGLFDLVKAMEAITGTLVLIGLYVPLALVAALPISVVVAYFNLVLEHNGVVNYVAGTLVLGLNLLLMLAYVKSYQPLLRWRASIAAG
ncbi:MAG TPA: hypothetical protein VIC71_03005 [Gammaproteobacteria bacterium]|jgi:hypothetical protein